MNKDFFTPEHQARIVNHMNEEHSDAILRYARYFGKARGARAARLEQIDREGMNLLVDPEGEAAPLRITFAAPLKSPEDAHDVLVSMAREARQAEEEAERKRIQSAHEALEFLRREVKTIILGTADERGQPDASVAPFHLAEDGTIFTYVSELSVHTFNLRQNPRASVMWIEDESEAGHLLARRRLTLRCEATFLERDSEQSRTVMEALKQTYGGVMSHLSGMIDFSVVGLRPTAGRLVAGFGQAYDIDPLDWKRLAPVNDNGHTSGHKSQSGS